MKAKILKGIFLMFFCTAAVLADSFTKPDPVRAVKEMAPGINLGNTLDAIPNEDSWGNGGTTEATIRGIRDAGFKSIRIPVTWFPHMGPAPEYKIDPQWMDRVEEIVDWSLNAGLYAVLNVHHDSWKWMQVMVIDPVSGKYVNDAKTYIPRLEKLWAQIAARFKDKGDRLIFEILNEPDSGPWETKNEKPANPRAPAIRHDLSFDEMNEITLRILKVMRTSGGNNADRLVMICPRGNTSDDALVPEFRIPPAPYDRNLILTVHYYGPWHFVSSWWGKYTWGSDEEKQEADESFRKLHEAFVKKGVPVVLGEWGAFGRTELFSRWYYFDYIAGVCARYGMATMWWDTGGDYFRNTQTWRDPVVRDIVVNRANGIANSFVLVSDAYIRADRRLADLVLDLELNGNRLVGVYNETAKKQLNPDDYSVDPSGSTVTIRKRALSKIVKLNRIGVNAVLRFDFSRGINQPVNLVVIRTPAISRKTVTLNKERMYIANDVVIPARFHGTKLAAVKLVTTVGEKSVKEAWTPYLNEGDDYDYSAANGSITLKHSILSRISENSRFVFEFWPTGPTAELGVKLISGGTGPAGLRSTGGKTLLDFQSGGNISLVQAKDPVRVSGGKIDGRDCLLVAAAGLSGWSQDYLNLTGLNTLSGADWGSAKGIAFMIYVDGRSDLGSHAQLLPVLQSPKNYWMLLNALDLKAVPKDRWIPITIPVTDPKILEAMPGVFQVMFIFNTGSAIDAAFAIDDFGYTTKKE